MPRRDTCVSTTLHEYNETTDGSSGRAFGADYYGLGVFLGSRDRSSSDVLLRNAILKDAFTNVRLRESVRTAAVVVCKTLGKLASARTSPRVIETRLKFDFSGLISENSGGKIGERKRRERKGSRGRRDTPKRAISRTTFENVPTAKLRHVGIRRHENWPHYAPPGSRAKRRRKRRQWVSVCRKPRIVPPLPPRAAEQSGFVSWKRASYITTTTWPQFQLFRRYRQIEEATSAKRSETIVQVVLRFKRVVDSISGLSWPTVNDNYASRERIAIFVAILPTSILPQCPVPPLKIKFIRGRQLTRAKLPKRSAAGPSFSRRTFSNNAYVELGKNYGVVRLGTPGEGLNLRRIARGHNSRAIYTEIAPCLVRASSHPRESLVIYLFSHFPPGRARQKARKIYPRTYVIESACAATRHRSSARNAAELHLIFAERSIQKTKRPPAENSPLGVGLQVRGRDIRVGSTRVAQNIKLYMWGRCLNAPVTIRRWCSIKPARNNRHYLAHTSTDAGASDKIAETIVMERTRKALHLPIALFARTGVSPFNFDSARRRVNARHGALPRKKGSDSKRTIVIPIRVSFIIDAPFDEIENISCDDRSGLPTFGSDDILIGSNIPQAPIISQDKLSYLRAIRGAKIRGFRSEVTLADLWSTSPHIYTVGRDAVSPREGIDKGIGNINLYDGRGPTTSAPQSAADRLLALIRSQSFATPFVEKSFEQRTLASDTSTPQRLNNARTYKGELRVRLAASLSMEIERRECVNA
ncbi:hypothetical protein DBV15_08468 [Temnothorax longispinosus]|uniref:Uncharacterized protein n=1 Tax=Temnothorax longispinosus TaxID=300112 RepID=A0A4S2KQ81_9HYME|nr:hypothetical protein DBV15_08468 [Temnothorax longispinosus]